MRIFKNIKSRIATYGIIGGLFGGIGGVGLFGVCHTACQAAIAVLAAIGITGIGMPFAFLQNPIIIAVSWTISGISIIFGIILFVRYRRRCAVQRSSSREKALGKHSLHKRDTEEKACHDSEMGK